jgi:hypothetical protein
MDTWALAGSAIYSTLNTAGTVPVYDTLGPQGTQPPYAVYQLQAAVDDYTFTSSEFSADVTVKVLSNRTWPGESRIVYGHLHDALQDAGLSIPGFSAMRCRRTSRIEYQDSDLYWHSGGIYRVDFSES